jgi:type II secretion system protein G
LLLKIRENARLNVSGYPSLKTTVSDPLDSYRRLQRILTGGCVLAGVTLIGLIVMVSRHSGAQSGISWSWGSWNWPNPWSAIWDQITMPQQSGCTGYNRVDGDLHALGTQLMIYENIAGRLPTQGEGLKALLKESRAESGRRVRKLLGSEPLDPWGRPYQYRIPALHSKEGYDLFSLGSDGGVSSDDIGNWD